MHLEAKTRLFGEYDPLRVRAKFPWERLELVHYPISILGEVSNVNCKYASNQTKQFLWSQQVQLPGNIASSSLVLLSKHCTIYNTNYPQRVAWPKIRNALSTAGNSMTSFERGVPSRTEGEKILEMLWRLQMPCSIGFGGSLL